MGLLVTVFVLGLIVGVAGLALAARRGHATWIWRNHGGPRPPAGYATRLGHTLHVDLVPAKRDSINAAWCRGEVAMDSIRQPIRPSIDSLFQTIRPRIDSLYQPIKPAIETRRGQTRNEIRALLPAIGQQRYDSLNRADDAQRAGGGAPGGGAGSCNNSPGGPGPRGGVNRGSH
jgi:hypothetical protein